MKTSVTKMMMSFALMGCLIIGASDASAQGRSRSQGGSTSSRSQSAAVSRSSNHSTAPQMSRSSSSTSRTATATPQVSRSSSSMSRTATATPQVSRSSSSTSRTATATPQVSRSSSSTSRTATATPQVSRSSSSTSRTTMATPSSNSQVNRPSAPSTSTSRPSSGSRTGNGAMTRGGSSSSGSSTGDVSSLSSRPDKGVTVNKSDRMTDSDRKASLRGNSTDGKRGGDNNGNRGIKPNGGKNGNMDRDNHNGNKPNGGHNGNMDNDKRGHKGGNGNDKRGNRGGHDRDRHGYDNHNHFDYNGHHYRNEFHHNYGNHSWSWSRPLPPPARPYRPAPLVWYRPVIPAGWHPYAGAPVIDRILGITFGTLFDASLDYLYYNGYEIDGYADHIIYLRNVPLVNYIWDDVMLSYDSYDRLVNAQFVFHATHSNRLRYERVYRNLCRVYGQPVARTSEGISWYGGNSTGWVTLSMHNNLGHYYTTLSIGY